MAKDLAAAQLVSVEELVKYLPEKPRDGMMGFVRDGLIESELGGHFCIYSRESMVIQPELTRTMCPEEWAEAARKTYRTWGAVCDCTACGERFEAGWVKGGGFLLMQGEDGLLYDGYVERQKKRGSYDGFDTVEIREGDEFVCPICGNNVKAIRASGLRYGRTYQCLIASVDVVQGYAAVVTWLVTRNIDCFGYVDLTVRARDAVVVTGKGIVRFSHTDYFESAEKDAGQWKQRTKWKDSFYIKYYDFNSVNRRKVGGLAWKDVPDLTGTTGETTALDIYIRKNGNEPNAYLRAWSKKPQLENLLRAGFANAVICEIEEEIESSLAYSSLPHHAMLPKWVDWEQVRPSKMLHMNKTALREMRGCGNKLLSAWMRTQRAGMKMDAALLKVCYETLGEKHLANLLNAIIEDDIPEVEPRRVLRYLQKQEDINAIRVYAGVQLLIDLRKMQVEAGQNLNDQAVLWPKNLRQAHDLAVEQQKINESKEMEAKFELLYQRFSPLEWTDGTYCIRLPRKNADLVKEGDTLHHCVGGYGKNHIALTDVIFFVRRYRRPERSFYTLDMCFQSNGKEEIKPRQKQLHGYRNDTRRKIPAEVLDFVLRWKEEICLPWWQEQLGAEKPHKNSKNKKVSKVA